MNRIRFTPLDADGQPTGEPVTTAGEAVMKISEYLEPIDSWQGLDCTRHPHQCPPWEDVTITLHNKRVTKQPDDPDLAECRIFARNMAIALDIPPWILGVPDPSRPIPSRCARGYQKRVKARRHRNKQ